MAELDAMIQVLEAQGELFLELARLADQQRQALLGADVDALTRLSASAETLALRFQMLETERQRLETASSGQEPTPRLERARDAARRALSALMSATTVSGHVMQRLADHHVTRQAAVYSLFSASYLPDGRTTKSTDPAGQRLRTEG